MATLSGPITTAVAAQKPATSFATTSLATTSTGTTAATTANKIVLENQKTGNPVSEWGIDGAGDSNIEGFATDISTNVGNTVSFKINTDSNNYRIDIYRLGYYGGLGARKIDTIQHTGVQNQPAPLRDASTGLVDAGNWSVSASWSVPADAVSGVYIAKLTRQDGTAGVNEIPFIVRDDSSRSDVIFQTADQTWQAYNPWGGANFYGGNGPATGQGGGRAYAVSYNRPITTRGGGLAAGPQDYIYGAEFPAIMWLEQNGYDVSYMSGVDADRNGALIKNHKMYLDVGHDEYWSGQQRTNVEAARDAGVNLSFWSGNEVYWRTRFSNSISSDATPYRTLVSYKETWGANQDLDPTNQWTGTFRDPRGPAGTIGNNNPENALTGTIFQVDSYVLDTIQVPYDDANLRFWRNTSVANLQPGQTASLNKNYLGYEWDEAPDNASAPAGLVRLSSTTVDETTYLQDYGNTTGKGTATHSLTLYRAPSGALVFGAGSVYWSWGLSANHDNEATPTDPRIQQAMVNLLADMGIQPGTLDPNLKPATASTDRTAPTSTITTPSAGTTVAAFKTVTITGTASDVGGVVAGVEVSTDNGVTWRAATGDENWSYTFAPQVGGTYVIRSRATDDSVNLESPSAGRTLTVTAPTAQTLFSGSAKPQVINTADTDPIELGVQFQSSTAGTISGIRFYKGSQDMGTHTGTLWSSTGQKLATTTFTGETTDGWQTATFSTPVTISPGTTYTASYHTDRGHYSSNVGYFTTPVTSGSLTASTNNGVFVYGSTSAFPTQTFQNSNFWVDVLFNPGGTTTNQAPTAVNDTGPAVTQNTPVTFSTSTLLANDTDPNGDPLTVTGVTSGTGGTATLNTTNATVTFTPTTGFTGAANFTYAISDGRGGTASASVALTVSPPGTGPVSLFPIGTPATTNTNDTSPVELGVKFQSSTAGTVSAIKFYKGTLDTGTHTGTLWSSSGQKLATVTFANETASGWQTATFSSPVALTAGTTYTASYHTNAGRYSTTNNGFASPVTSGPLTAPSSGNGVYAYGATSAFPTQTFQNTNYWVDVVFNPGGTTTNQAPTANNDTGPAVTQNTPVTFSTSTLLANDTDPNGDPLTVTGVTSGTGGTATLNTTNATVTFTPTTGFTGAANFTYAISDGRGGTASASVALTVSATGTGPVSLFPTGTPATTNTNDTSPVELGVKFQSSTAGTVSAIKFYKGTLDTGTHTGTLWSSTGQALATATFANETASGWQTATFSSPVTLTAGTTYTASYHTNAGRYSTTNNGFASPVTSGPLTAPSSGNGVYAYGATSTLPTQTFQNTNYWVDVVFNPNSSAANQAPTANNDTGPAVTRNTPVTFSTSTLLANDTDPNGDPLTVTGVTSGTGGTATLNTTNATVTFTPTTGFTGAANFTYAISDGHGGTASASVALTVSATGSGPVSLFPTGTPATTNTNDTSPVELGVKFQSSTSGTVSAIKFYKGTLDTGTHTGTLWSSSGQALATATFTDETASGWQTATFSSPVALTAGTTYTASYHTNAGRYSTTSNGFANAVTSGSLTAPASDSSGGNGVFAYGSTSLFPTQSYNRSNYWVDVVFNPSAAA
ncbi:Mo-co oxidoreductase dimerization domain protein [Methylobacterium platani]|uniref:Mo-co oxidoreductase dimerization domain protein n=1 Tax=Methylobacterium platani TaxID=427683 RepID=A0A179SGR4_9HYPH|nr:Mo-co oxidoreductase dimerization domain protein [Methylobacterium platani]